MIQTIFGTDGIRKRVGTPPFTAEALQALGHAIGAWALKKYGPHAHLLLAHDTRLSCNWFKATLKSGLLTHPLHIHDAQVLPTPGVFQRVYRSPFYACGIVISASHNPSHDNGIKIITATDGKILETDELEISHLVSENSPLSYETFGTDTIDSAAHEEYLAYIARFFPPDLLASTTVVLDCAHGAVSSLAPLLFSRLGAQVIVLHNSPNGTNINANCGALHPQEVQKVVIEQKAHFGFAFDGDGDRVIAVAADGTIIDGDAIVALLSTHPLYKDVHTIVGTVMSNQGLEQWLITQGKNLLRTPVGDKHVAQALQKHNLMIGGEQCGHLLAHDYLPTSDGMFIALRLIQTAYLTGNTQLRSFAYYPQALINIPIIHKRDLSVPPFSELIAQSQATLAPGRVLVRYSGTESTLRVMTEAHNHETAHAVATELAQKLAPLLS